MLVRRMSARIFHLVSPPTTCPPPPHSFFCISSSCSYYSKIWIRSTNSTVTKVPIPTYLGELPWCLQDVVLWTPPRSSGRYRAPCDLFSRKASVPISGHLDCVPDQSRKTYHFYLVGNIRLPVLI